MNNADEATMVHLIRIAIEECEGGWYVATSRNLPGLVLANKSRDAITDDLPEAIKLLYSVRYSCECEIIKCGYQKSEPSEDSLGVPLWGIVEREARRGCDLY